MGTEIERLRAENDLLKKRLLDAKEIFGGDFAMQIRTPFYAVRGYADILLNEKSENLTEEKREQLGIIKKALNHGLHFVEMGLEIGRYGLLPNETQILPVKDLKDHFLESQTTAQISSYVFSKIIDKLPVSVKSLGINISLNALDHSIKSVLSDFFGLGLLDAIEIVLCANQSNLVIMMQAKYDPSKLEVLNLGYLQMSIGWSAKKIIEVYGGTVTLETDQNPIMVKIELGLVQLNDGESDAGKKEK